MIDKLYLAYSRVLNLFDHITRKNMLVLDRALDVVDSRVWHAASLENLQPFLRCLGHEFGFYERVDLGTVLDAERVREEAGVGFPFWTLEFVAEDAV